MKQTNYLVIAALFCGLWFMHNPRTDAEPIHVTTSAPATRLEIGLRLAQNPKFQQMRREAESRRRQMQADHERRRKEIKLRHEEMELAIRKQREDIERTRQRFNDEFITGSSRPEPPPFIASAAGPPEEFFEGFIRKVRRAQTMDDFITDLPLRQQDYWKREQKHFDPAAVEGKKAWFQQNNPKLSPRDLKSLTQTPYARGLEHYQSIAKKFRHIKDVEVNGNKATIHVATRLTAIVNGVPYDFSSATVKLVGEGNRWRVSGYEDSGVLLSVSQKLMHLEMMIKCLSQ